MPSSCSPPPWPILAQAAGAASMPFFASLWAQEKRYEFATQVADSVSRVTCLGLLAASGMVALGLPVIDFVFVGGRFSAADARECAAYFAVFSISLFLWSAQAIYSRAFYAAGNTFVPMVAGTIVTADFPANLFRVFQRIWGHGAGVCVRYRNCGCRRWPLPSCCISGTWFHLRVSTIANWGGAWLPRLPAGLLPGSSFRGWPER